MLDKMIGFIGAGNMGSAMIGGILDASLVTTSQIIASAHSPETLDKIRTKFSIETTQSNEVVAERSDILFLAVKPNKFAEVLPQIKDHLKPDFFLVGETLHGDYNQWMNDSMLHSVTNYECYKGLYSSFNSMNMFEINHSLLRQFGPDNWTLYKGRHLLCFVDNHDVTRIASILTNEKHLPLIYGLLFGMPGIPCVYYGSEWGAKARKEEGDPALRACFLEPEWNDLSDIISRLAEIKKNSEALNYGSFRSVLLTNRQCIFERKSEHERIYVAINADENSFHADFDAGCGTAQELITDTPHDFGGGTDLPGYSVAVWKMEH